MHEQPNGNAAFRDIAGYPATLVEFQHAGLTVTLYQVARLEELVDRQALLREDVVPEPPYWAHLWIGARALARELAERGSLAGRSVLDVGCGLGLPGLVARALGADVSFVDRQPAALAFVRESSLRNGFTDVRSIELDFTRGALGRRFDVILGAELVYDPESYQPLCAFLTNHLAPGGIIHLTDAFRSDAERFFDELRAAGFAGTRRPRREWEEGRPHGVFLWTFGRSR